MTSAKSTAAAAVDAKLDAHYYQKEAENAEARTKKRARTEVELPSTPAGTTDKEMIKWSERLKAWKLKVIEANQEHFQWPFSGYWDDATILALKKRLPPYEE